VRCGCGTTIACAQFTATEYEVPITQQEYFRFFPVFNNPEDPTRRMKPNPSAFTKEQERQNATWQRKNPKRWRRS